MTREEARQRIKILSAGLRDEDSVEYAVFDDKEALEMAISALSAEPCDDCISRQAVLNTLDNMDKALDEERTIEKYKELLMECIKVLPSAENKNGRWERMSDLPEDKDDRYKCSRCGNVVHYSNGVNLYTFNSWCGRCGSLNNSLIAELESCKSESEEV